MTVENLTELRTEERARLEVEASLAQSDARFSALFLASVDGIVITNTDGDVEAINPAACELFGYHPGEVPGQNVRILVPPGHRERHSEYIHAYLNGTASEMFDTGRDVTAQRKDGTLVPIRITVSRLLVDGEVLFAAFVRDRTVERQLEEQLRQSNKLEAIGTLASGIAHDFNNLLMGIGGCVQIAIHRLDASHSAQAVLQDVLVGVNNGSAIARQLLAFGRPETGGNLVSDAGARISDQVRMLERLLGDNICIAVDLQAEQASVEIDPGQLDQIVMNLAVNARDAMPAGGKVTIACRNETVGPKSERALVAGRYLVLSVTDQGEGMDAVVRSRALEPFYTTKSAGTGLGLSTVYGIASHAGGCVRIQSVVGEGTTVEVLLPVAAAPVTQPKPVAARRPTGSRNRVILLVEDDPRVRMTARYFLDRQGYRVLEACSLAEARTYAAGFGDRIDLLLTDIMLPDGQGTDIIDELRRSRPGIVVLLMSAHKTELSQEIASSLPRILVKPFDETTLADRIAEVFAKAEELDFG